VKKLPAGCLLRIPAASAARALELSTRRYWSLEEQVRGAVGAIASEEAVAGLERVLARAIGEQMVADVPVGAFLSGGVDSSVVVALMQRQAGAAVKTFSIGFNEDAYNEAHHAKAVAAHLGTDHTELYVTADEARQVIPALPSMYDEPFGDSSQIPTFLVARMARRKVTVSLSGDGGDELFGGYNRYVWASRVWNRMSRVPVPLRRAAGAMVRAVPPTAWDRIWALMPARLQVAQPGDKLHKLAGLGAVADGRAAYEWLVALYRGSTPLVAGFDRAEALPGHGLWGAAGRKLADDMMLADALGYLPDDILAKVDRATMAVSLESRAPFLDHRVVEFAFSLPLALKLRGGATKWLLRQLLYRHVPRELIDRPKMGFGVPIDAWLRGPLKQWAGDLINPQRLHLEGFVAPQPVAQAWREHQSGRFNHQHFLWNVLMFQAWLEQRAASRVRPPAA
jgi:asparagine synthase (glutamine-hydrolysing)